MELQWTLYRRWLFFLPLILLNATSATVFRHDRTSPAIGKFPGRRLASSGERRQLIRAPLYGSINQFAYYFLDVLIGTPPQRQSVILDSGSSLIGFPCNTCGNRCGKHLDKPFNLSASSTAQMYNCHDSRCNGSKCATNGGCSYAQVYSEGSSIQGSYFSDILAVHNGQISTRYDYIGCHSEETNLFTSQDANGILGVSYPKGTMPTVMDSLWSNSTVNSKVFTICPAEEGGELSIGGYDASLHVESQSRPSESEPGPASATDETSNLRGRKRDWWSSLRRYSPMLNMVKGLVAGGGTGQSFNNIDKGVMTKDVVWIPIDDANNNYIVDLRQLYYKNESLVKENSATYPAFRNALMDSGTTYTYLPQDAYNEVRRKLLILCSYINGNRTPSLGTCTAGTGDADLICINTEALQIAWSVYVKQLPSFYLRFNNGAIVEWGPDSWMFEKNSTYWCSAIENNRGSQTILGLSFMKNKQIIFDRDNENIGIVSSTCPSHKSEERNLYVLTTGNTPSKNGVGALSDQVHLVEENAIKNSSVLTDADRAIYNDIMDNAWTNAGRYSVGEQPSFVWPGANHSAFAWQSIKDGQDHLSSHPLPWAMAGGLTLSVVTALVCMTRQSVRRRDGGAGSGAYTPFPESYSTYPELYDNTVVPGEMSVVSNQIEMTNGRQEQSVQQY